MYVFHERLSYYFKRRSILFLNMFLAETSASRLKFLYLNITLKPCLSWSNRHHHQPTSEMALSRRWENCHKRNCAATAAANKEKTRKREQKLKLEDRLGGGWPRPARKHLVTKAVGRSFPGAELAACPDKESTFFFNFPFSPLSCCG